MLADQSTAQAAGVQTMIHGKSYVALVISPLVGAAFECSGPAGNAASDRHVSQERRIREQIADAGRGTSAFAATYYRGDGLGFNLHLSLREGGTFECSWTGCLGNYGKSTRE
jgi:hypothetical protein